MRFVYLCFCAVWLFSVAGCQMKRDVKEIVRWKEATIRVGEADYEILRIDRPDGDWDFVPYQHEGIFVQFFRFFSKKNPDVWIKLMMMSRPVKSEMASAMFIAQGMKEKLPQDPTVRGVVTLRPRKIKDMEAVDLLYGVQEGEGPLRRHLEVTIVLEHTWFRVAFETPAKDYARYLRVLERFLSGLEFNRQAINQFWESQRQKSAAQNA